MAITSSPSCPSWPRERGSDGVPATRGELTSTAGAAVVSLAAAKGTVTTRAGGISCLSQRRRSMGRVPPGDRMLTCTCRRLSLYYMAWLLPKGAGSGPESDLRGAGNPALARVRSPPCLAAARLILPAKAAPDTTISSSAWGGRSARGSPVLRPPAADALDEGLPASACRRRPGRAAAQARGHGRSGGGRRRAGLPSGSGPKSVGVATGRGVVGAGKKRVTSRNGRDHAGQTGKSPMTSS